MTMPTTLSANFSDNHQELAANNCRPGIPNNIVLQANPKLEFLATRSPIAARTPLAAMEPRHNDQHDYTSSPKIKNEAVLGATNAGAAEAEDEDDDKAAEATFPQQLMDVIEGETTAEGAATVDGERVCEWLPAGDSFIIRDKKAFEKAVLPKYFSAKCKFMSFIRKLYRWGFRQVEKSIPGIMIFTHTNFVRGDKQRCLKMRSIVKKQMAQPIQQRFAGLADAMAGGMGGVLNRGRLQGYGSGANELGMMGQGNLMGMGLGNQIPPHDQRGQMFPPSFKQGGDALLPSLSLGLGGQSSLFNSMPNAPNQFSRGGMSGMTSSTMFQAGLHLERMEHQQQARKMQMMDMLNTPNNGMGNNNNLNSFNPNQSAMPLNSMSGNFGNAMRGAGSMTEVELASEIMKRGDPGMEPWKALELAKRFISSS